MERQKKVLDASVVMKWFTNEDNTEKAIKLREQHINQEIEIIMPEFAILEIINGLRYKKKVESELKETAKNLAKIQLTTVSLTTDQLQKTIKIALDNDLSIYDSLYAAVAQLNGCILITADKDLAKLQNSLALDKI